MTTIGSAGAPAITAAVVPDTRRETVPVAVGDPVREWRTVVWDDPVNLMSYVTYVFQTHFGYGREKADALMLAVHQDGRAIVASGGRERMEAHVEAMHTYGLWATLEKDTD